MAWFWVVKWVRRSLVQSYGTRPFSRVVQPTQWPRLGPAAFSRLDQSRSFSTTAAQQRPSSLRKFVKFLHPDLQTAADAKEVNLKAIQNLNSYLDTIESLASKRSRQKLPDDETPVEIDFVIMVEERQQAKKRHKGVVQTTASRRKVQLAWPSREVQDRPRALLQHTQHEMAKLLRVAGLPVPIELETFIAPEDAIDQSDTYGGSQEDQASDDEADLWADVMDLDRENERVRRMWENGYRGQRRATESQYARLTAARNRFTRSIDWKKLDVLYKQAWREAQADMATRGVIRNSRERRRLFIANILSRCVPDEDISVVERFCAMRRLSLLLEQNFDRLELEDCSAMWDQIIIRLKGAREYNTSSSAMHKRRLQQADNGFAFALDASGTISVEIPLDFRDDELLEEWDRNLWDFYDLMGDDLDDIFIQPQTVSA